MFYQLGQRLRRWRVYLIVGLALLAAATQLTGFDLLAPPLCDAPPEYVTQVPIEIRAELDQLYDQDLLYCRDLREGLAPVAPRVYWASDGMNSVFFFQALEGQSLLGVGVTDYSFGDGQNDYFPSIQGDRRHPRFDQAKEGRRAWRNENPDKPPTYFYRRDGAPGVGMVNSYINLRGPALEQEGATDRDFLQDFERFWQFLRRQQQQGIGGRLVSRDVSVIYDPERWDSSVSRDINPIFLDEETSRTDYESLSATVLPDTKLYQSVQGLSGSTVWVAGVISGTTPAMVLTPREGGTPIEPLDGSVWYTFTLDEGSPIAHFAFPRQADGSVFEALYWDEAPDREGSKPDHRWPVAFSPPSVQGETPGGGE